MSNPFVFDGVALPGDRTAWLAGGLDPDGVVRSFSVEQTGSLVVNGMTTTESLTTSGGLITPATRELNVDGDGLPIDSGYGIWPAATNLVTNGGFETNTTGWNTVGTNTIERSTEQAKFGAASCKCTIGDSPGNIIQNSGITLTAAAHAFSVWVYIPSSYDGTEVRLLANAGFGSMPTASVDADMSLRDQWQRLSVAGTPVSGDLTGNPRLQNPSLDATPGSVIYCDGWQIELGSVATPYIETDGSTESRTAGRVQMPVAGLFTATQGAVFARVAPGIGSSALASGAMPVWEWRDDADNRLITYYDLPSKQFAALRRASASGGAATIATTFSSGDSLSVSQAWTATTNQLSLNGGAYTSAANTAIPTLAATLLDVGNSSGASHLRGNVRWFATFAGTLTDADAAALNAFGDTPPTWAQLVSSVAICAMPTALWRAEDDTFIKASYAPDGGS